ncbi:hypothetical protein IAR55_001236 [Kwoniella newhampshirensis]|uniref:Uncharacterized protein n=1 Tax=Kwoniella newhampshirensis TaxID=1651941 RepID=A0AAW0Z558_9TREE
MSAPLPYDATPSPEPELEPIEVENPALDRPLDEYEVPLVVPDHVRSLMGRMSKGKVYLMEESPAILHVDSEERVRRDPRIAALAERLDAQDPTSWLDAISAGAPSPIKPLALYLRSDLIQHLSTSKVFSWASSLGANVLGIEWLNDTTLQLIFPTPAATLLGLTLLSKAGFDPAEGDDPLLERAAHSVPISLLPLAEPDPVPSLEGQELLSTFTTDEGTEGGVRRKGRGKFGQSSGLYDLEPLVPAATDNGDGFKLAPGVDPHARIAVRYAVESDSDLRKEAKQSEWYKRHGRTAGKEVASSRRNVGGRGEEGLSFDGRGGSGEGREFARRLGRERNDPYGNRPSRGGGGRKTQDDLDRELENMAKRRVNGVEEDVDMDMELDETGRRRRGGGSGGGGRREDRRRGGNRKEDLDKELDDLFAARTTT